MTRKDIHELAQVDRIARALARQKPAGRVWPWAAGIAVVGLFLVALGASIG